VVVTSRDVDTHWLHTSESQSVMGERVGVARRASPHAQAHPAGCRATSQLTRLALSAPSLKRKCHESVMSTVMGGGPTRWSTSERKLCISGARGKCVGENQSR